MSKQAYDDHVESTYVEPGRDVGPPPNQGSGGRHPLPLAVAELAKLMQQQIASLIDTIDRLQRRVEELERREPW